MFYKNLLITFKKTGLKLNLNLNGIITPVTVLKVTGNIITVSVTAGGNNGVIINVARTDYINVFIIVFFFAIGALIGGEV